MFRGLVGALLVAVMIGTAGCGDDERGAGTNGPSSGATYVDPAQPIRVNAGDHFRIALTSNATTGLAWQVTVAEDAPARLVDQRYEGPETTLIGAGGQQVFEFTATSAGTTALAFEYRRSFEQGVAAADTKTFNVIVAA
jgi:predicted secreted protein